MYCIQSWNVPLKLRLPAAVIMCTESPYGAIQKRENVLLKNRRLIHAVALLEDSIARKLQKKDKLIPVVVGRIPREISRFVWYFITYGGKVCSQVYSERPMLSPIPSGGLEILLMVKLTISDEKRRYLAHVKTLSERNYQVVEK